MRGSQWCLLEEYHSDACKVTKVLCNGEVDDKVAAEDHHSTSAQCDDRLVGLGNSQVNMEEHILALIYKHITTSLFGKTNNDMTNFTCTP